MSSPALLDRADLADRYADETRVLLTARLRVCCVLGVTLVPVFLALDWIVYPEHLAAFAVIRVAMVAGNVVALLALSTRAGTRHVLPLTFFVFVQTGLGIVAMTALGGGGASPYYAGVNLVMLAAAVLMPWELPVSIGCCAVLVVAYVAACALWAGTADARVFTGNLFFLCSTALITVVSHGVGAAAHRREFLQRVALAEAGRHRDHFLANVTHELRTPLAAILGFCEMLTDYTADATSTQLGWLARIRENALALYRLIVQVLDFSKIEAGALELVYEQVHVHAIVAKVAEDMRAIAGPHGTQVIVEVEGESPALIGDGARVEEILTNLASNALKFSAGHPVTLRVTTGAIDEEPGWNRIIPDPGMDATGRTYVRVAVIDRGTGIRPEDLRRLFVAFRQLDGSSTRRHGGTGLGLAISARLAAAMHAHIAVRSRVGDGSTFALVAPLAAPTTTGTRDAASADALAPGAADQPALAVLVAER
jgi:signal transduction histidine kinase